MHDRFRVDGVDLRVDRRSSFASVDERGVADAVIRAVDRLGDAVVRLVVTRVPLRFDGEMFGATVDAELRDRLFVEGLAVEEPTDEGLEDDGLRDDGMNGRGPAGGDSWESEGPDPESAPLIEAGVALHAGSRVEADGRLTHHAGDRLRFLGEVVMPGAASPTRLDVVLTFGRRVPRI
jgi:hypothetical protein